MSKKASKSKEISSKSVAAIVGSDPHPSDVETDEALEAIVAAEEAVESATDSDLEDAVRDVESDEARAEAYAEQDAEAEASAETPAAPSEEKPKKRMSTAGMKPSEIILAKFPKFVDEFAIVFADADLTDAQRQARNQEMLTAIDGLAKKIAEKAVNVVQASGNGVTVSVYTRLAIDFLREKRSMTLKDLREHYESGCKRPYSAGTASAQASQMFTLLPFFKVATRNGKELVWNDDTALGFLGDAPKVEETAEAA